MSLLATTAAAGAQTIAAGPLGPAAPAGGWSLQYGDAFGDPICGTRGAVDGHCDNTLVPNRNTHGCGNTPGFNPDEMEQFNCSQVSVGPEGLDLSCTPTTGLSTPRGSVASHYLCGVVSGEESTVPRGYQFFRWRPGEGQEWAVQVVAQFPANTGEADPSFWSSDWADTEEIDFFEGFGLEGGLGGSWCDAGSGSNGYVGTTLPTWIYNTATGASLSGENSICHDQGFDPAAGFHTYTTVFYPNDGFAEYIDGKPDDWSYVSDGGRYYTGGDMAGPPPYISNATMGLILSYGLRDNTTGDPDLYFLSGTRSFLVRSIAVYENARAHGANSFGSEVAPGTTPVGVNGPARQRLGLGHGDSIG